MRRTIGLSVLLLLAVAALAAATNHPIVVIKGAGCLEEGVEGGCLVLHDLKTKVTYNLRFQGKAPAVGTAITFEGTANNNPNTCMQGTAVDVTTWTPVKMHCPPSKDKAMMEEAAASHLPMCGDWAAWYNVQPVGPHTMNVAGMCTFPTSGYKATVKPRQQDSGSSVYVVELEITKPTGIVNQVIVHAPVHTSQPTEKEYASAQIEPDHVTIRVTVIH